MTSTTQNPNLAALSSAGVSVWLDDLSRERLQSGNLQELIDTKSVVGVTTNPSIFQKALAEGDAYDAQVAELAERGADVDATIRTVTTDDVRNAADVLRPQWEASDGVDGRVSIEVDPRLAHDTDKTSMATLARVFPALAVVKKSDEEHISLVNGGIVEEVLLPLGQLDFGKGQVGKCDIALWRTRGEHKSLVGEFAFQVKFPSKESVAAKPKKLAAQFFVTLQQDVQGWIALGVTKTGMVYRMKGNEPQSHE